MRTFDEAFKEVIEKHPLEDGDDLNIVFNNCSIVLGMQEKNLEVKIILDDPIKINETLDLSKYLISEDSDKEV